MFKNREEIHFGTGHCRKYASYAKIFQIKVVQHWILYKKFSGQIYLSPPRVELGSSKDCHLLKYYNVQKWGSRFTLGLYAAKNTHYIQKCFRWKKVTLADKPHIHKRTEWFANQMRVCLDGTANLCCVVCDWFAYHLLWTKIYQFFVQTQRELDAQGIISMHWVSFPYTGVFSMHRVFFPCTGVFSMHWVSFAGHRFAEN